MRIVGWIPEGESPQATPTEVETTEVVEETTVEEKEVETTEVVEEKPKKTAAKKSTKK